MTVLELIDAYKDHNPHGHFFDKDTLKFFGERLSDMRVFKGTHKVTDAKGREHDAYILSSLQRNHPICPRRKLTYFDAETFEDILL